MKIEDLSAGDLMQAHVVTVPETALLADAARIIHDRHVSSLVVEKLGRGDAFGILTRKDIVVAFSSIMPGCEPLLVRDAMTKPAITVAPELSIAHCMRLMRMAGIRRIPIEKDGALVGILSNSDLLRWYIEHLPETTSISQ